MIGDFKQYQNEIVPHCDKEDIISCIITLGDPPYGGETLYSNDSKQDDM